MSRLAALLFVAAAATLPAASWDEIGEGSASMEGLFHLADFDPEADPTDRIDVQPQLGFNAEGRIVLGFYSTRTGTAGLSSRNGFFALGWLPGWDFLPGTDRGAAWAGNGHSLRGEAKMYAAPGGQVFAAPGVTLLSPATVSDVYAGSYDADIGWFGEGTSLDQGGITDFTAYSQNAWEVSVATDGAGFPCVAYAAGPKNTQGIYFKKSNGSAWAGLGASPNAALAVGGGTKTNVHPAIGFAGSAPVVAWCERVVSTETVKLLRFDADANAWTQLATSFTTGIGSGRRPQLAWVPGRTTFFVAYENLFDGALAVKEWSGSAFVDRGNPLEPWGLARMAPFDDRAVSNPDPSVANFAMALDRNGRPCVAFRAESPADSGRFQIFVSYFDRTANEWVAVGDPANPLGASGIDYSLEGLEGKAYGCNNPALTLGLDDRPTIAWELGLGSGKPVVIQARRYSESISNAIPTSSQAVGWILGTIDRNPVLGAQLDFNDDASIDAGDVERLPR